MRNGIADFRLVNLSYPGDDVTDSAGIQGCSPLHLRRKDTHLFHFIGAMRLHEPNFLSRRNISIKNAGIHDNPAIVIVDRIKDESLQG